uniref:NADH dehydrogenase subunit 3 n=1 Tax=Piagetiella africana TaxID=2965260 RepID=UPI00286BDBA4|nr:NADH dehydrogenase subunit 3 [Piagetiella africana]WKF19588.1 NADH dehydrogenase subunit 3 [Piagetiella africana]
MNPSMFFLYMLFSLLLSLLLLFVSLFFMENIFNESSESPFECGFEPISFSRVPFSIQFFSISIIFLVFDLEVTIIVPLLMMHKSVTLLFNMSLINLVLILGLLVEWNDGSLEWVT